MIISNIIYASFKIDDFLLSFQIIGSGLLDFLIHKMFKNFRRNIIDLNKFRIELTTYLPKFMPAEFNQKGKNFNRKKIELFEFEI